MLNRKKLLELMRRNEMTTNTLAERLEMKYHDVLDLIAGYRDADHATTEMLSSVFESYLHKEKNVTSSSTIFATGENKITITVEEV